MIWNENPRDRMHWYKYVQWCLGTHFSPEHFLVWYHFVRVMYLSWGTVFTSLRIGLIIFRRWLIWWGDISRQKLKTRPAEAWSCTSSLENTNLMLLLYWVWPVSRLDSSSLPIISMGTAVEKKRKRLQFSK